MFPSEFPGSMAASVAARCEAETDRLRGEQTPSRVRELLAISTDMALNERDTTGDGDQSALREETGYSPGSAQPVRDAWCTGGDMAEYILGNRGSRVFQAAAFGNAEMVREAVRAAGGGEAALETRGSLMRQSPLLATVTGARVLRAVGGQGQACDHAAAAEALVSLGARIEARDVAGHTALALSANGTACNLSTMRVGAVLAKAGANPDAENRWGVTAMTAAVMSNSYMCVAALCEWGGNPRAGTYKQYSAFNMARLSADLREVMAAAMQRKADTGSQSLVGKRVCLQNMPKKSKALDRREGVCMELDLSRGKYKVRLDRVEPEKEDRLILVSGPHLIPTAALVGAKVTLCTGALDGKTGMVASVKDKSGGGDVEVKLDAPADDGSTSITVRAHEFRVRKKRDGTTKRSSACDHCGKTSSLKKCNGCFAVQYCGRECQLAGWSAHKAACKAKQRAFVTVDLSAGRDAAFPDMISVSMNFASGNITQSKKVEKGGVSRSHTSGTFVVKVQASPGGGPHMIYNKDRDVDTMMASTQGDYQKMKVVVKESYGELPGKAYCNAWLNKKGELVIDAGSPLTTPPGW